MALEDYLNQYDKDAKQLQEAVRNDEASATYDYDEAKTRRAIVHAREDITLIVSYLSSLNLQLASVKRLLLLILVAVIILIVWR